MTRAQPTALPPTAAALLRILVGEGGTMLYRDDRMTTSGLTALRHRGLAYVVQATPMEGARVSITPAGRSLLAAGRGA